MVEATAIGLLDLPQTMPLTDDGFVEPDERDLALFALQFIHAPSRQPAMIWPRCPHNETNRPTTATFSNWGSPDVYRLDRDGDGVGCE